MQVWANTRQPAAPSGSACCASCFLPSTAARRGGHLCACGANVRQQPHAGATWQRNRGPCLGDSLVQGRRAPTRSAQENAAVCRGRHRDHRDVVRRHAVQRQRLQRHLLAFVPAAARPGRAAHAQQHNLQATQGTWHRASAALPRARPTAARRALSPAHLCRRAKDQQVLDGLHKHAGPRPHQAHSHNRLLLPTVLDRHVLPLVKAPQEQRVVYRSPGALDCGENATKRDRLHADGGVLVAVRTRASRRAAG